ncbi:hypothetical protein [Pseudomonas sp. JG-B]|uniref:hypothetical protein n=1 Tax=Pseudomonas sp. JG-B TaxID=2603214 RepID=UPI00129DBBCD|nr:hypothetical protein [Pseudomonas sp. JG-B]MRK19110.1 hypothetical protein [Pseudomonas sp. JG-B]
MTPEMVFYVPGQRNALDYARVGPDGQHFALFDGRSLEELRHEFPTVEVITEGEFYSTRKEATAEL